MLAPAPLKHRDLRAERRGHREQEAQDRLDRHQDGAEGERQQDERQADHDQQEDRQRVGQLGRHVDVGGGRAAHQQHAQRAGALREASTQVWPSRSQVTIVAPWASITW